MKPLSRLAHVAYHLAKSGQTKKNNPVIQAFGNYIGLNPTSPELFDCVSDFLRRRLCTTVRSI